MTYELTGFKWGSEFFNTPGGQVRWAFAEPGEGRFLFDAKIVNPTYQQLVRDAFDAWESVANIDFVETQKGTNVSFLIGMDAIDGPNNIVGQASFEGFSSGGPNFSISYAEVRFDTAEIWSPYGSAGANFYAVALHEIGHAIGLDHVNDPMQIMYPFLTSQNSLAAGDIQGAQLLYGAAVQGSGPQFGGPGNEIFVLTSGNDTVNGGGGVDTAIVNTTRAAAIVTESNGTIQISGPGLGSDILSSVERLSFDDGSLAFDVDGIGGQAYRLYEAAFNRVPDTPGLGYWLRELDAGRTDLFQAAAGFIASSEFQSTYGTFGGVSNAQLITLLYNNVLDRLPDNGGFVYWNDRMDNGLPAANVLVEFSESAENQQNVAGQIGDGIWYT